MSKQKGSARYSVAVRRSFVARHYLVGGDWGDENDLHSHAYQVELEVEGADLDEHGYLVDIVDIEERLDILTAYYRDRTLNELPEFDGFNPSIEHFSRIFCDAVLEDFQQPNVTAITVRIWEAEIAWASFRREIG